MIQERSTLRLVASMAIYSMLTSRTFPLATVIVVSVPNSKTRLGLTGRGSTNSIWQADLYALVFFHSRDAKQREKERECRNEKWAHTTLVHSR